MKLAALISACLLSVPSLSAAATCKEKVEVAAEAAAELNDPHGSAYSASARLLTMEWESNGLAQDRDLQLWKVKMTANSGSGLPSYNLVTIARGEGSSACTLVKTLVSQ